MGPNRRTRRVALLTESLEDRGLLSGGAGAIFAMIPATVPTPGTTIEVPFTIARDEFHIPHRTMVLGVDLSAQNGSPAILSVDSTSGKVLAAATHSTYTAAVSALLNGKTTTSAATIPVTLTGKSVQDAIRVAETDATSSGPLKLGFFLAGDANGDGSVDRGDIKAIQGAMGAKYGDANYSIDMDANRDGVINKLDLKIAMRNLGVRTSITPVFLLTPDATAVDPKTQTTTHANVTFSGTATPGSTVTMTQLQNQVPKIGGTTDASGHIQITTPLSPGPNTFQATMSDEFGQKTTVLTLPVRYAPAS